MCPPDFSDPQNPQVDTLDEINSFYTYNDPIPGCGCGYLAEVNATHDTNATQPVPKNLMSLSGGEATIGDQKTPDLPENADFILLSTSASIISQEGKPSAKKDSMKNNSPNQPKPATKPSENKLSDVQASININPELKKKIAKVVKPVKDAALGYLAKKIQEEIRR